MLSYSLESTLTNQHKLHYLGILVDKLTLKQRSVCSMLILLLFKIYSLFFNYFSLLLCANHNFNGQFDLLSLNSNTTSHRKKTHTHTVRNSKQFSL